MCPHLSLKILLFSVSLLAVTTLLYADNPTQGWDFDILDVSVKGSVVKVDVCSRSQPGLDGFVMVICRLADRGFVREKVFLRSGEWRSVYLSLPQASTKGMRVSVNSEDIGAFGHGWWQFDDWDVESTLKGLLPKP